MNLNISRNTEIGRATMLAISDASKMNEYTIPSSLTETNVISMDHNRRLISEIIDSTFNEQKGICEASSSECCSLELKPSEYSYEKRLKYWKNILRDRELMSVKIRAHTDKDLPDILYNRSVTVDERDKSTVKRLMDCAQRLNPTSLSCRQPLVLREICAPATSTFIRELQETLPQMERRRNAEIEIVGLPKVAQEELLGESSSTYKKSGKPYKWLESKYLENSIDEKRLDIKRILEYYPDTENLQIVGESLQRSKLCEHDSEIQIRACKDICKVSNDTPLQEQVDEVQPNCEKNPEPADYALKINDQEFFFMNNRCNRNFTKLTNFTCFPFQTVVKEVLIIQNIGRKVLSFEWAHCPFYPGNPTLLKCRDKEFVFDQMPFRLCSSEVHTISVMFQPRRVGVVKSKWILKVNPAIFKRKIDGIAMSLCGLCAAPPEYEEKLAAMQREVINKSNREMVKDLTTNLISFATDLQQSENPCPYQRSLNKMELFEQLNVGFKCERYNDLELLQELYERANKPRSRRWDLRVNSIKRSILNVPVAETRALLFNELFNILDSMRGNAIDLETKLLDNKERYRSRLLYVRGIIATVIDEWTALVSSVEESFHQSALQDLMEEFATQSAAQLNIDGIESAITLPQKEIAKRKFVVGEQVHRLKPFRDALFLQTYTMLCDCVENIVNVIESTE